MAGKGGTVTVVFLGDAAQLDDTLAHVAATSDATAAEVGASWDKATASMASAFARVGKASEAMGLPLAGSLTKMGAAIDGTTSKAGKFSAVMADIGSAVLKVGAVGFVAASAAAVKFGMDLQEAEAKLAGTADISVKAATAIGNAFNSTGGKLIYSGTQLTDAYEGVAAQLGTVQGKALTAAQAMTVMKAASDLAEASGESLNSATSDLGGVMQVYGIKAKGAAGASDILFNTSRDTTMSLDSVASTVEKLHGRLGAVTPSLSQVGGLMIDLVSKGAQGRQAVSGLSTAMSGLLAPSATQKTVLDDLGTSVYNAQGKFVGLSSVMTQLHSEFGNLTEAQQLFAAKTIFGTSSYQGMLQVINQGPAAFDKYVAAASKADTAANAAAQQNKMLSKQLELLKTAVEDFASRYGQDLINVGDKVAHAFADIIGWFTRNKAAAVALGSAIAVGLGAAISAFVATKVAAFVGGIGKMTSSLITWVTQYKAANAGIIASDGETILSFSTTSDAYQAAAAQIKAAASQEEAAFAALAAGASSSAEAVAMADEALLATTRTAAAGIDSALIGTGIGAALVALGVAADLLLTHWQQVWDGMKTAAYAVSNFVINQVINPLISAFDRLVDVYTLGIVQLHGELSTLQQSTSSAASSTNPKNSQYVSIFTGAPSPTHIGAANQQVQLPSGTTANQAQQIQALIDQGKSLTTAEADVLHSQAAANAIVSQQQIKDDEALEKGMTGLTLSAQKAQVALDKVEANPKSTKVQIAAAEAAYMSAATKEAANTGSGNGALGGTMATDQTQSTSTAMTQAMTNLDNTTHQFEAVLKDALAGGTGFSQQGATVQALTAATSSKNASVESSLVSQLNASGNTTLTNLATTLSSTWTQATNKITTLIDSDTTKAQSELQKLQSAQQSTSLSSMTDAVDSSAKTSFNQLVNELVSTHSTALAGLVKQLESNWTAATTALADIRSDVNTAIAANKISNTAALTTIATTQAQSFGQTTTQIGSSLAGSIPGLPNYNPVPSATETPAQMATAGATQTPTQIEAAITASTATMLPAIQSAISAATANPSAAGPDLGSLGTQAVVDNLNNAATAIKDAASVQTAQAQQQTTAITDAMNIASAAAQTQAQQITDAAKLMSDAATIMVNSINAQTTATTDAANAQVQAIQDQTQIQVDTLGERGLYGLQLVAQEAKVALDQQVAIDDANIAAAQANLDQVTAQTNQAVALAQQKSDADQAANDAAVAAAQMSQLITTQSNDANVAQLQVAAAQAQQAEDAATALLSQNNDTVQLTSAIANAQAQQSANEAANQAQALQLQAANLSSQEQFMTGPAADAAQVQAQLLEQQANNITTTATQIVDAIQTQTSAANQTAADALNQAEAAAALQNTNAQAALTAAQNAASIQNAQQAAVVSAIQSQAAVQAAQDAASLSAAQASASIQQALAQQQLSAIQSQAQITEAKLTSIYNVTQEEADVEYAGSGITINILGLSPDNAAAIGAAASYALRYQVS